MKGRTDMKAAMGKFRICLAIFVWALALTFFTGAVCESKPPRQAGRKEQGTITHDTFSRLAERLKPAVVNISTTMVVKRPPMFGGMPSPFGEQGPFRDFWEDFFFGGQMPREFETKSLGSGFMFDKEGYIVTNNHVVRGAKEILVTLHNKEEYKAEVIGGDEKTDLALIKIDTGGELPVAALGNSDRLEVGEWVIAIGNPFGLAETVTAGIVSAKGRVIGAGPYDDFIQTDASINPGNSGGPLFNFWGEVVGINTAIVAGGQGIGFAIPINMAKEVVSQLKEKGKVTRGWLGVGIQRVTSDLAESFGLEEKKGALVAQVFKGGPADAAGVRPGDIILEFDGKEIEESADLPRIVASTPVGKTVTMKVFRKGEIVSLQAKVGEMEEEREVAEAPPRKPLGITVQNVTPKIAKALGLEEPKGVVVAGVEPGSAAERAGIRRGDVILEVDHESIEDVEDLSRVLQGVKDRENILFLVRRGENNLFLSVSPG
jgi:serine protease Do